MNYTERLQKVSDYIGQHLDENISLEQLSDISCLSKFHFHRLFSAFRGISLGHYIRWLRLKRAAHQLIFNHDQSILTIAINAGFESHEAFTRAFKQVCGYTPSQFRSQSSWVEWAPPYDVQKQGETEMKVEIKKQDGIRLAVIEHRGNPALLGNSVNKLIAWANAQAVKVGLKPGESFAIAYDDPTSTPTAEFRMDLGIKVPANLALTGEVVEKYLPAGRYATTMHKGSRESIGNTVYALYRDWLPNSGEELGDFPCVFCYHNFDHEVAETEQLTECMLLCK